MQRSRFWVVLLVAIMAGCAGSDKPTLGPVEGTVTLNGKPLASGMIIFTPVKGRPATGKVEGGKIVEVTTFELNDGAPVGNLVITVIDPPPMGMEEKPEAIVPEKYSKPEDSEITIAVYAGRPNEIAVELSTD